MHRTTPGRRKAAPGLPRYARHVAFHVAWTSRALLEIVANQENQFAT
jgi:hypothetical protein